MGLTLGYNVPITYDQDHIAAMAEAWPEMSILVLCPDPVDDVGCSSGQPLKILGVFAEKFPRLQKLGIYVNSLELPKDHHPSSRFTRLNKLDVGTSPGDTEAPLAVALYLGEILLHETVIKSERSHDHTRALQKNLLAVREYMRRSASWETISSQVNVLQANTRRVAEVNHAVLAQNRALLKEVESLKRAAGSAIKGIHQMHVANTSPILPHWSALGFSPAPEPPICPIDLTFLENIVKKYLATPPGVEPPPAIKLDDRRLERLNRNIRQLALRGYCLANGIQLLGGAHAQGQVHPSQDSLWDSAIELADGMTRDIEALEYPKDTHAPVNPHTEPLEAGIEICRYAVPSMNMHPVRSQVNAHPARRPRRPAPLEISIPAAADALPVGIRKNNMPTRKATEGPTTPRRPPPSLSLDGTDVEHNMGLLKKELAAVLSRRRAMADMIASQNIRSFAPRPDTQRQSSNLRSSVSRSNHAMVHKTIEESDEPAQHAVTITLDESADRLESLKARERRAQDPQGQKHQLHSPIKSMGSLYSQSTGGRRARSRTREDTVMVVEDEDEEDALFSWVDVTEEDDYVAKVSPVFDSIF
ncbi:hypothetical protein FRB98_002818 [Tulasnella sp. 332]|nr:hypothetical protein FRB98_002818 [Tulasnella sp. 332]